MTEVFYVDQVIDLRKNRKTGKYEAKVTWFDYSEEYASWIDDYTDCPLAVLQFLVNTKKKIPKKDKDALLDEVMELVKQQQQQNDQQNNEGEKEIDEKDEEKNSDNVNTQDRSTAANEEKNSDTKKIDNNVGAAVANVVINTTTTSEALSTNSTTNTTIFKQSANENVEQSKKHNIDENFEEKKSDTTKNVENNVASDVTVEPTTKTVVVEEIRHAETPIVQLPSVVPPPTTTETSVFPSTTTVSVAKTNTSVVAANQLVLPPKLPSPKLRLKVKLSSNTKASIQANKNERNSILDSVLGTSDVLATTLKTVTTNKRPATATDDFSSQKKRIVATAYGNVTDLTMTPPLIAHRVVTSTPTVQVVEPPVLQQPTPKVDHQQSTNGENTSWLTIEALNSAIQEAVAALDEADRVFDLGENATATTMCKDQENSTQQQIVTPPEPAYDIWSDQFAAGWADVYPHIVV